MESLYFIGPRLIVEGLQEMEGPRFSFQDLVVGCQVRDTLKHSLRFKDRGRTWIDLVLETPPRVGRLILFGRYTKITFDFKLLVTKWDWEGLTSRDHRDQWTLYEGIRNPRTCLLFYLQTLLPYFEWKKKQDNFIFMGQRGDFIVELIHKIRIIPKRLSRLSILSRINLWLN